MIANIYNDALSVFVKGGTMIEEIEIEKTRAMIK